MTHTIVTDNRPTSITKNEDIQVPVTVLECPPIKIAAILLYKKDAYGEHCVGQINTDKLDIAVTALSRFPFKENDERRSFPVVVDAVYVTTDAKGVPPERVAEERRLDLTLDEPQK